MDTPDSTTLKRCTKCGELKPFNQFSKHKCTTDGLQYRCKACAAAIERERYADDPEHKRVVVREYKSNNRDRVKEQYRSYNQSHAENRRAWKVAHPDRCATHYSIGQSIRRARKAGNGGTYTTADLIAIRAAQTDKKGRLICWRCGKPIEGTPHLDHWIPVKRGGKSDAGNQHYMHARCNLSKGAMHPYEIGRLI